MDAVITVGNLALSIAIDIASFYLVIGIIDFIFQNRTFKEEMKMTKQELKDEYNINFILIPNRWYILDIWEFVEKIETNNITKYKNEIKNSEKDLCRAALLA